MSFFYVFHTFRFCFLVFVCIVIRSLFLGSLHFRLKQLYPEPLHVQLICGTLPQQQYLPYVPKDVYLFQCLQDTAKHTAKLIFHSHYTHISKHIAFGIFVCVCMPACYVSVFVALCWTTVLGRFFFVCFFHKKISCWKCL